MFHTLIGTCGSGSYTVGSRSRFLRLHFCFYCYLMFAFCEKIPTEVEGFILLNLSVVASSGKFLTYFACLISSSHDLVSRIRVSVHITVAMAFASMGQLVDLTIQYSQLLCLCLELISFLPMATLQLQMKLEWLGVEVRPLFSSLCKFFLLLFLHLRP
jgi:hypothetical protein